MEEQFETFEAERAWNQLYQGVKDRSSWNESCSIKEARKPENKNFNRYRDVNPFDHSRIVLVGAETDYINASEVPIKPADRRYILTQGPLAATVAHFWLMVWEQNTKGIVMLNKLIEKNIVKCHQYWPESCEEELSFSEVKLKVNFIEESQNGSFVKRSFRLTHLETDEERDVVQFHYTNWPDFGVPRSPQDFLDFLYCVRESGCLESTVGPAIIHCSAGIGRSGTFCLVDSILRMVEDGVISEAEVDVVDVLMDMRRYRMSLIQTAEQLRFSYLALIESFRQLNKKKPYLEYENTGENKPPPPPPHRSRDTEAGNKPESAEGPGLNGSGGAIDSSSSSTESFSLSDGSGDDEDENPPPLPPRDIPSEVVNHQESCDSSPTETHADVKFIEDELRSFEEKILVNETMTREASGLHAGCGNGPIEDEMLLRKRMRDQKLSEQIRTIKKGIKDADDARERQASFDKFGVGIVLFIGAGCILYKLIEYIKS